MNIGKMVKVFEYSILRENGINVLPEQVGLKTDPYEILNKNASATNGFSSILANVTGSSSASNFVNSMPTPPTPPTDASDVTAQQNYQQQVAVYTQKMQAYNQKMMAMMMQQFQLMQQRIQSMNMQQTQNNNSGNTGVSGTGGILSGTTDIASI